MQDIEPWAPFQPNYTFDPHGRQFTGNPVVDSTAFHTFGYNYMPQRRSGQDMADAFIQRERSMQFMQVQRTAFANSMIPSMLGMAGSPWMQAAGQMFGSPDGALNRMLSPLQGGNPVAAQMQLFAKLGGSMTMGNFGRGAGISVGESTDLMKVFQQGFYNTRSGQDLLDRENSKARDILRGASDSTLAQLGNMFKDRNKNEQFSFASPDAELIREGAGAQVSLGRRVNSLADKAKALYDQDAPAGDVGAQQETTELYEALDAIGELDAPTKEKIRAAKAKGMDKLAEVLSEVGDGYQKLNVMQLKALELKDITNSEFSKATGINFTNSRGFEIEDITSGFASAANLRMLGDGKTTGAAAKDFVENAGGAMSAARSIWGDGLSGGEYVQKVSNLVGTAAVDLSKKVSDTDAGSGASIEATLRKVKATARVAGTSIDVLLGIIDSAKEVARSNPQLQYMSALGSVDMGLKAVSASGSIGAIVKSDVYRKAGGSQQIAAGLITEEQKFLSSDVGSQLAVMHAALSNLDEAEKQKGYEMLDKAAAEGITPTSLFNLRRQISQLKGAPTEEVLTQRALDPIAQSLAMSNDKSRKFAADASGSAVMSTLSQFLGIASNRDSVTGEMWSTDLMVRKLKEGKDMNTIISELPSNVRAFANEYKTKIMDSLAQQSDPGRYAQNKKTEEAMAAAAAQADKKYARFNAPVITQLFTAMSEGGWNAETARSLASTFVTDDVTDPAEKQVLEEAGRKSATLSDAIIQAADGSKLLSGPEAAAFKRRKIAEAAEANSGRGVVNDEYLTNEDLSVLSGSLKGAKDRLKSLQDQAARGTISSSDKRELQTLIAAERSGLLDSVEGYDKFTAGNKTIDSFTTGLMTNYTQAAKDTYIRADKKNIETSLQARLDTLEVSGGSAEIGEQIRRLKGDYTKKDKDGNDVVDWETMASKVAAGTSTLKDKVDSGIVDVLTQGTSQFSDVDRNAAAVGEGKMAMKSPIELMLEAVNNTLRDTVGGSLTALTRAIQKLAT